MWHPAETGLNEHPRKDGLKKKKKKTSWETSHPSKNDPFYFFLVVENVLFMLI